MYSLTFGNKVILPSMPPGRTVKQPISGQGIYLRPTIVQNIRQRPKLLKALQRIAERDDGVPRRIMKQAAARVGEPTVSGTTLRSVFKDLGLSREAREIARQAEIDALLEPN